MENINYLLLYHSSTDKGGQQVCVRSFAKLESAIIAMNTAYGSIAATLNLHPNDTRYTMRTEKRIRLERYGDVFSWEIIDAVPEDGQLDNTSYRTGLRQFTVTIEEHISQEFPVRARDFSHAFQIAEDAYWEGKMVVKPSSPNTRLMMARDNETEEITQWKEF